MGVIEDLKSILIRDALKLKEEIKSYKNEQNIWKTESGISNSAGNLCLHLIGNLNHFIGAVLGNTGYIRNRELEFTQKNVPVSQLEKQIDKTVEVIENTFNKLLDKTLEEDFPLPYHDKNVKTLFMLTHIVSHLDYHIGQINYLRRLFDK